MKKLFFTAIALVAFSTVSLAETKEVKPKNNVIKVDPCKETFSKALNLSLAAGNTPEVAWSFASACYDLCNFSF